MFHSLAYLKNECTLFLHVLVIYMTNMTQLIGRVTETRAMTTIIKDRLLKALCHNKQAKFSKIN